MGIPLIPILDADSIAYASAGPVKEDEPLSYALQNCKRSIEAVVDAFDRGLEIQLYLTGSGNFREQVATIQPYKGNRTQPKPPFLPDVRQYMLEVWRANLIDGKEADDAVAIEYLKDPSNRCVVSIDKDLNQIPGWHYDYRKQLLYEVSEEQAKKAFWMQVLTGDVTDHIRGLVGVGPKTANKILRDVPVSGLGLAVKREYNARGYTEEYLNETCKLLYLLRHADDSWETSELIKQL